MARVNLYKNVSTPDPHWVYQGNFNLLQAARVMRQDIVMLQHNITMYGRSQKWPYKAVIETVDNVRTA
jgi:hypothetical protein